jgi:DNA-binding NtrC family response regulator
MADDSLVLERAPDPDVVWRYMRRLVDRLFLAFDDLAVDEALDILVELLGADRGLVLLTSSDGSTIVVNARGQNKALASNEREEVSRTIISDALASGRCITWDPLTSESSSSVAVLGIRGALAAPLQGGTGARDGPRGVLYVDFRDRRKQLSEPHVEFFMAASTLIGAVLELRARSLTDREQLAEAKTNYVESKRTPPLSDLLATPSMRALRADAEMALATNATILVLGESGTGKTLLAEALAEAMGRRPIVRAVLGSSDDLNTITSELFGHEKGAYSGATSKRVGLVEFAHGGTLILDEILNLPPNAQQLLLDFTQFGTYRPLGYDGAKPKRADVRLIAATNGDIQAAIRERRFREDLFYRLAMNTLHLPPLRQRREDIPAMALGLLKREPPGRPAILTIAARRLLQSPSLDWPGNVRQLESVVFRARARALARDPEVSELGSEHFAPHDLSRESLDDGRSVVEGGSITQRWHRLQDERAALDEREQGVVREALNEADGVVAHAARALGIARTTFASRLEALGIHSRRSRQGD